MSENDEVRLFDDYGEEYAVTDYVLGYAQVAKLLSPLAGTRVLDYGTGSGKFARFLHREGASVIGVDISKEMIAAAETREDGILYAHITSGDLSLFPDGSFDAVVANFVLCMIESPDEILKITKEAHRVLKPDGKFIILHVNWDDCAGREFVSFSLENPQNLQEGARVTTLLKSEPPLPQVEYYRPVEFYTKILSENGFSDMSAIKPTLESVPLEDKVRVSWLAEALCPPFVIISARKR